MLYALCSIPSALSYAQAFNFVRVAIIRDAGSLNLKVNGFYKITDSNDEQALFWGRNLKTTVIAYKDGILLGAKAFNLNKIFIKTNEGDAIIIDGRKFKGKIQFIKDSNAKLYAINYVDLEDYVKGILYHEASHYWPQETLKAQAITSRTYAVYQSQENKLKSYDLTSDIYSQVYGGRTSERYQTNKAVDETKGYVLTYQNKAFPAYYHATCSGHTQDASLLWNIDLPVLKGVFCDFCKQSPHFKWHYVLSLDEIKNKLLNAGYKINKIKDIQILGRDKSGRIRDLNITTLEKDIKISSKDFRNIIGPNIIRSAKFALNVINQDVVCEGFGWGHGVGLCQWGSYFMAKLGFSLEEILKYYYPGAKLEIIRF